MNPAHGTEVQLEGSGLLSDTLAGLSADPRELPCKYLYDKRGSELFNEICELEEYYPTRTELAIMDRTVHEMARALGPRCLVLEYGSGTSRKTEVLLDALELPVAYVPIDISCELLADSAARLRDRFPGLELLPVCADYTADHPIPQTRVSPERRVVYFPGSTIGNFDSVAAARFLRHVAEVVGPGGGLLIGVDLDKDRAVIESAYNDALGVTADFNLNLLVRINRELGADFNLDAFRHRAIYNSEEKRIEMYLDSLVAQEVHINGESFRFERDEAICTEHSHKYSLEGFAALAQGAGFEVQQLWVDDAGLFSVQYLTVT